MDQICFICKKASVLDFFKMLEEEVAPFSGKSLKMVLRHIIKCTQTGNALDQANPEIVFDEFTLLCSKCYNFLIDYDEQVVKLMNLQKKFKFIYENAVKVSPKVDLRSQLEFEEEIMSCDEEFDVKNEIFQDDLSSEELESNIQDDDELTEYVTKELFQCKYCPTGVFEDGEDLKKHVLDFHHTKKESVCTICNISLKDEEHLELHKNLHEGKTENECRYCDKRFTHKSSVIRHMAKHWDKKKYQCEKCGVRFSETPRLYNHKLLHEAEENPLICHICNQLCKTRRTYKRHMNTHREDRPRYPCHICGKTFSEKFTLKPHLRTHPEYVESKNKQNNEAETLAAAEKIIEIAVDQGKESFICNICGAVFSDSDEDNFFEFNKHMEKVHNVSSAIE